MTNNINIEKRTFDDRDEYNRKPIAEKVISLLQKSSISVSPMIIDGGWGTGKTEFCHKLINLISQDEQKLNPIYINAFQADHADEPLMTLLASILSLMEKKENFDSSPFKKRIIPVLRFSLKTIGKTSLIWALKQGVDELNEGLKDEMNKTGNEIINNTVDALLKEHKDANKNIQVLQDALKKLTETSSIVIFVDELDRCRPDFAVSMLENIKHIFNVDGVQFVLVTNSEQLRASINHSYGTSIDAKKYLDKFIRFSFTLPVTFLQTGKDQDLSTEHFCTLIKADFPSLLTDQIKSFWVELFKNNQLSLREVETFTKNLKIYSLLASDKLEFTQENIGVPMLKIFGVFICSFFPELQPKILIDNEEHKITAALRQKTIPNIETSTDVFWTLPDHMVQIIYVMFWMNAKTIDSKDNPWKNKDASKDWENNIRRLFPCAIKEGINYQVDIIKKVIKTLMLTDDN